MDCELKAQTLVFKGILDENFNSTEARDFLNQAVDTAKGGTVKVDFSKTKYANSAGILLWLKMLENFDHAITFINAPKWLVNQFNMVPQLINNKNKVESIEVPFYNADTEKEMCRLFVIGQDIPVQDSYEDFIVPPVMDEELEYVPDIIPEKYFSFIAKNAHLFGNN